jgi:hypothetical protein
MIHILKNKKQEFYWLSVVKKANTFEENAKSSESFTSKQNCLKSVKNEASGFAGTLVEIMDHTGRHVVFYEYNITGGNWVKSSKSKVTEENFNVSIREVRFVQKLKKY